MVLGVTGRLFLSAEAGMLQHGPDWNVVRQDQAVRHSVTGWLRPDLTVTPTFSMSLVRTHFCVVVARWCLRASCRVERSDFPQAAVVMWHLLAALLMHAAAKLRQPLGVRRTRQVLPSGQAPADMCAARKSCSGFAAKA